MPPMIVAPGSRGSRDERQRLRASDLERVGPAHVVDRRDAHGLRPHLLSPLGPDDDERADDECARDRDRREEVRLIALLNARPRTRRGKERDDEIHARIAARRGRWEGRSAPSRASRGIPSTPRGWRRPGSRSRTSSPVRRCSRASEPATIRWPVDETGRNSVRPSTMPRKSAVSRVGWSSGGANTKAG